jgi:tetratricopeptide (TPR) repeat protein
MTRLERFMKSRKIEATPLARESNIARQHITRIRAGNVEPRRKMIAAMVSALRRLTLEPIQAEDVFELTVEESGAWRRTRGASLDERTTKDQAAARWIDAHCTGTDDRQWKSAVDADDSVEPESLARILLLRARADIDESPERAAALGRFALAILSAVDLPRTPFVIHLRGCAYTQYANALLHIGDYMTALQMLDRAEADLVVRVMSANDLAQAWYVRAMVLWKRGDFDHAALWSQRSAVLFGVLDDPRRVAFTQILEASIAFERGDPARAKDLLRGVLGPLKRSGDKRALAAVALSLGTAEGQLGNIAEAKRWIAAAEDEFDRLRVKPERVRARWSFGYFVGIHENRLQGLDVMRGARRAFESLACESTPDL